MGFDVTTEGTGSRVRIFIDYALPERGFTKLLGLLAGDWYAKWCTQQMLGDLTTHFAS